MVSLYLNRRHGGLLLHAPHHTEALETIVVVILVEIVLALLRP